MKKKIENYFTIEINSKKFVEMIFFYCKYEKYMKRRILKLFLTIRPRCFVEVYTPNRQLAVINEVCHVLNIPVVDIQHGALGEYEPIMYSYKQKKKYDHLCDFIFVFGSFWKKKSNIYLLEKDIMITGNPFLEKVKKNFDKRKDRGNSILLISQARYHNLFLEWADRLNNIFECKIVLRLHPYENAYFQKGEYENLRKKGASCIIQV